MFRCISIGLVMVVLTVVVPFTGAAEETTFTPITPQEAALRNDFIIIDVREPHERLQAEGYIDGSRNISMGKILSRGLEGDVDKTSPILLVCRTGVRSSTAAAKISALGFEHVYSLDGGMVAWNDAGLEVTTVKAEKPAQAAHSITLTGVPCDGRKIP